LKSKSKWIAQNDFKSSFGKTINKLEPMVGVITTSSPYQKSPVHHKFREVSKEKWVNKKNFRF